MNIVLENVWKRFADQEALRGIDLSVETGTRLALVGPNGSGKSTLLRILMGLLSAEGKVLLDGRDPFRNRQAVAHRLAYVPQTAPQLGATVRDVVQAVADLRGIDVARIGAQAGRLGLDLESNRDKAFRSLSGGMKQKLLIALAFSSEASLFILDEPTASLDGSARDTFLGMLDEASKNATVLLCSHRPDDVQKLVSRMVELGEGKVVRDVTVLEGGRAPRDCPRAAEAGHG